MIRYFYNHPVSGDVLFVLIAPDKKPLRTERKGDAVALYGENDTLLGYNVFNVSKTLKITSDGMLFAPEEPFVEAVNAILVGAGFEPLPYEMESGFHVYRVTSLEEHPLNEKAQIVGLEGKDGARFESVSTLKGLAVGKEIVAAIPETILLDGSVFHKCVEKNLPIDLWIVSAKDLRLGEDETNAFVPEREEPLGSDFFYEGR